MSICDKIYNLLLEEPLSQPAKRTLALHRLSKKAFVAPNSIKTHE